MALCVQTVDPGSPAERLGITPGCMLLTADGHEMEDSIDYQYYTVAARFPLTVCQDGQQRTIQVVKEEYEPLGCNFKTYLGDEKHSCDNHCMFCFIDQMPKGMRKSLYFKDDDERLSFLFGNYITMTNLSEREVERIIQMHISPIFISVRAQAVIPGGVTALFPSRRASRHADRSGESHHAWHGQLFPCRSAVCSGVRESSSRSVSTRPLPTGAAGSGAASTAC